MMLTCIKQHLKNVWSSETDTEIKLKKGVTFKKGLYLIQYI